MRSRTLVLILLCACFGVILFLLFSASSHESASSFAQQEQELQSTKMATNDKLNRQQVPPAPPTMQTLAPDLPTRPDPSRILILSSAVGLAANSASGKISHHHHQHHHNHLEQTVHKMTDYLRNIYAAHHGYSYVLEGNEEIVRGVPGDAAGAPPPSVVVANEGAGGNAYNRKISARSLSTSPSRWARVKILEKWLLAHEDESSRTTSAFDWVVWMSTDAMIMNLDFQIEAILEGVPSGVDLVIGVNKLEALHFRNEQQNNSSRYLNKASASSRTRRKFVVDPGVMFFRRRNRPSADSPSSSSSPESSATFLASLFRRVSSLINDDAFAAASHCPSIARVVGERGAWQCAISILMDSETRRDKVMIVKNQRLFNSLYRIDSPRPSTSFDRAQEVDDDASIYYSPESTAYFGFDDDDDDVNEKRATSVEAISIATTSTTTTRPYQQLFIARVPPTVCGNQMNPCLDVAKHALETAIKINHLDADEFEKVAPVYERSLTGVGDANSIKNYNPQQQSSSSSSSSSIAILSITFATTSLAADKTFVVSPTKAKIIDEKFQKQEINLRLLSRALSLEYSKIHRYDRIHKAISVQGNELIFAAVPSVANAANINRNKNNNNNDNSKRKAFTEKNNNNQVPSRQERDKKQISNLRRKAAVELAKTLLQYLPRYEWIYVLPADALIFELDSSLEKLLLYQLPSSSSSSSSSSLSSQRPNAKNQQEKELWEKDLIITSQLKSNSVSEDTFFIRNSRWTRKILKDFVEAVEPSSADVNQNLRERANRKQIYLDHFDEDNESPLTTFSDRGEGGMLLLSSIVREAIRANWKSVSDPRNAGNAVPRHPLDGDNHTTTATTTSAAAATKKTLFVKDQHLFNSFVYPTDLGFQRSARFNHGDFVGRLVDCAGLPTAASIRQGHQREGVDDGNDHTEKIEVQNRQQQREDGVEGDDEASSKNVNGKFPNSSFTQKDSSRNEKIKASAQQHQLQHQQQQQQRHKQSMDQLHMIHHCFDVGDRMFEQILSTRFARLDDRTTEAERILLAAVNSNRPEWLSSSPSRNVATFLNAPGLLDQSKNPLFQTSVVLLGSRKNDAVNKNTGREVSWKKIQPAFRYEEFEVQEEEIRRRGRGGVHEGDSLSSQTGTNKNLLDIPSNNYKLTKKKTTKAKDGDNERSTKRRGRRRRLTTALLTVLCSSTSSVYAGNKNLVNTESQRRAQHDQNRLVVLHRQTFESKLAYAQLHGYDIIVEDCSVVEQDGGYASLQQHKQWSKLIAVLKWLKHYDRLLVLDAGMIVMDFDKSVDDLERLFLNVRRSQIRGAAAVASMKAAHQHHQHHYQHHQEPILMVSSDYEGVSSSAMLWRKVVATPGSSSRITTDMFLQQLLRLARDSAAASICSHDSLQSHADKAALRCILNHAITTRKNSNNNRNYNDNYNYDGRKESSTAVDSLALHSAVIVDTREDDANQNRRGGQGISQGSLRLLFGIPQSLLPPHDKNHHFRDNFRYKQGDFTAFLRSDVCFDKLPGEHEGQGSCLALLEQLKNESHDSNEYGRIHPQDVEEKVPLLLRPF